MAKIDEGYVIKQYQQNSSTYSIAKELGTYPKKIERILKKNGITLRTRSQAQANAIKTGRSKHPTKGEKRSEEEKNKISRGTVKNNNSPNKPLKVINSRVSSCGAYRPQIMPSMIPAISFSISAIVFLVIVLLRLS